MDWIRAVHLKRISRARAQQPHTQPGAGRGCRPEEGSAARMEEEPKPPPPETEQVIEIKKKARDAFSVFDREGRNACDVREVGTIVRSLNIYPTEKVGSASGRMQTRARVPSFSALPASPCLYKHSLDALSLSLPTLLPVPPLPPGSACSVSATATMDPRDGGGGTYRLHRL